MTPSQSKYLELLRSALWGQPCNLEVTEDVLRISAQQATTGLICSLSDDMRCRRRMLMVIGANYNVNTALKDLSGILEGEGVSFVLLKGQGCASYYPNPYLRNSGDIDIYVGIANYERACEVALKSSDKDKIAEEETKHFHLYFKEIPVEIHKISDVFPTRKTDGLYKGYEEDGLTRNLVPTVIDSFTVNTPSDTFNAFYIFSHFFHHFLWFGVGIRQVCDWVMLLHARGAYVDREKLGRMIESLGLMKAWKTFGVIAVDYLGLPAEEMPFYDQSYDNKGRKVLKRIFSTGNFGKMNSWSKYSGSGYFMRKLSSLLQHMSNLIGTICLFPKLSIQSFKSMLMKRSELVIKDIKGGRQ